MTSKATLDRAQAESLALLPGLYAAHGAAAFLGLEVGAIQAATKRGDLAPIAKIGSTPIYSRDHLQAWRSNTI